CPGDTAVFSTSPSGTGPFSFQWFKAGGSLTTQTNSTLVLSNISVADLATYSVQVTGPCNNLTNSATLTLNTPTTADAFNSITSCPGTTVSFTTTAHGTGPFSYQWSKDSSPLTTQTNSTLILTNISSTDGGSYQVIVTGACNTATNSASLAVNDPTS